MIEVSLDTIQTGVIRSLAERFPKIPVYSGRIAKAEGPYFYAELLKTSQEQELNQRYHRVCSFQVQYVTRAEPESLDMSVLDVAEQLYELFRELDIDGARYTGTQMRHEVRNGILHFDFSFHFLVWLSPVDESKMRTLKEEGILKDGSKQEN